MNEFEQVLGTINMGIVILGEDLKVRYWNRWMESHSGIQAGNIVGAPIFDFFPSLNTPKFIRSCKSVLAFGNFSYFSQKLHGFLFPFNPESSFESRFDNMQQSCAMGPLRDGSNTITSIYLTVQDVTELAAYEDKLIELNQRDGLTGVYNRRFLETRLREEYERHVRYSRQFSIIMFDIDFFKKVNDTYGHQCGDLVLKSVSGLISTIIRKTDCLARYGGEEFCCILPETDVEHAAMLAERFRSAVAGLKNVYRETEVMVTISLGVSGVNGGSVKPDELLRKADEALYTAKKTGRNKVVSL